MPSFTDTEDDENLSDPEDHSDDDGSEGSSSSSSDDGSDDGRGASNSFTSPGTVNDTSTRTSGSSLLAGHLGQEDAAEGGAEADMDNGEENMMSQQSANHPQRLFQSQDDSAGGGPPIPQQPPPPAGESHRPQQQGAKSDMNDGEGDEDEDGATEAPQQSQPLLGGSDGSDGSDTADAPIGGQDIDREEGELLTAPDHDGAAFGPNGTIVRKGKNEEVVVLTAPDHEPGMLGPTGTVVRQPRGDSKKPAEAAAAAAPAVAAAGHTDDDDKGSEGDDESGDDDDDKESEEEEESSSDEEEEDDDGTLNSHERERARILRVTHNELTNMGAALRCPICLHTLRRPAVLPCFHAFCYECINDSLDADNPNKNKKKSKSSKSPEMTYCDKCPTCKIKITKRSITVSEHLEDVAKSFKMVLPTFGMAPTKYDPQVEMTQYVPSDVTDDDDSMDDGDGDYPGSRYGWGGGGGRRKSAGTELVTAADHTQIAKAMVQALNHNGDDEDDCKNIPAARATRSTRSARAAAGAAPSASERVARAAQMQKDMQKRADMFKAADVEKVAKANAKHLVETARKQHDANDERRRRSLDAPSAAAAADADADAETGGDIGESGTIDTGSTTTAGIPGTAANESSSAAASATPMEVDEEEKETEQPLSDKEKAVAAAEQAGRSYLDSAEKATPQQQNIPWFRDSSVPSVDVPSVALPTSGSGNKKDISDITTDSTILREVAATAAVAAAGDDDDAQPSSPANDKSSPPTPQDTEPPMEAPAAEEDVEMMLGDHQDEDEADLSDYNGGATLTQDVREMEAADRSGELRDSQGERLQDIIDEMKEQDADQVEPGASQLSPDDGSVPSEQEDEQSTEEPVDMDVADDNDEAAGNVARVPSPTPPQGEATKEETAVDHSASPEKEVATSNAVDSANSLSVGTIVQVKARMWAGINKPGGVARIIKVHPSDDGAKYNVRYVLGGQEKDVDAIYVETYEDGQDEFASPEKKRRGATSAEGGTDSGPTRRGGRSRRAAAASKAKENKTPSPSAFMPGDLTEAAALKKALADSLQIESKTRARTSSLSQNSDQDDATAASESATKQKQKKRGAKRSKKTSANDDTTKKPAAKKQKKAAADASTMVSIPENRDVEAESFVMPASTKLHLADVRYKELLENKRTINAITSSLSSADKDALEDVIKQLKSVGVTIRVTKEFKPHVTDLCITARAETTDAPDNYILSKFRTLKAMRSALAGIPIVTPDWLRTCLDEKRFVVPADNNCIRTLPPKSDVSHLLPVHFDESTHSGPMAWLGVATYAALLQRQSEGGGEQYEHRPLVNTSVLLCGQFKKGTGVPPKADLVTLLGDSGATILGSVAAMNKELKKTDDDSTLVVLCDDAKSDKQSGITAALSKAMAAALEDEDQNRRVMVVTYMWLFDSVSCGELLDADNYKPNSPKAKSLWDLSTA